MLQYVRVLFLSLVLGAVVYLAQSASPPLQQAIYTITDHFDSRPERTILFIGNSRTFFHDIPQMVRRIADAAGSREKYRIVMHAQGGVRFEDHWNNPETLMLLKQQWHDVVLQGRSNEQQNNSANSSFHYFGTKLIHEVQANGAKPVLFLTWRYEDDYSLYKEIPHLKVALYGLMQSNYRQLADATGADIVNVGRAWEDLLSYRPPFPLYEDGNHQTVHGSYLAALMFYKYFSGDNVRQVTYVPRGITPEEAALIRKVAEESY